MIPSNPLTKPLKGVEANMKADNIVFLAEDDLDDQEMLIEAVKQQDNRVEFLTANTGSRALELLKSRSNDKNLQLIILDYNLPEISGAEILSRLRELNLFGKVPRVVWSTSNSPIYQKKCLELGAHSYIVKPTGIAGIKSIAKELIELYST
jgi:CheY-like chemotaxis protein